MSCYRNGVVKSIGSRRDELTIAQHLYSILREFDEEDVTVIYSEAFETPQMGQAIMNRLIKAAGHQVIQADDGQ
jgi:L-threonylcarbamoyladenylate synthase